MKHIIVKPIANPVMKKRAKFAKKLLGMSMTAGLVLLLGTVGGVERDTITCGEGLIAGLFGLAAFAIGARGLNK